MLHDAVYEFDFDGSVKELILKEGYDKVYGARPLKRAVRAKVEDSLSEKILDGTLKKGEKYMCSADENGHLTVNLRTAEQ